VVRGRPALVAPLKSRHLRLTANQGPGNGIEMRPGPFRNAFLKTLEKGLSLTGKKLESRWEFGLESDIPPSAGLGSSAALSVAVARFLVPEGELFSLALELENIFHGTSSGIDVAAVISPEPILFSKGLAPSPVSPTWVPRFFLYDTGLRSSTKACVEKVSTLGRSDLDERMESAVATMQKALTTNEGLSALAASIETAASCFQEWDLIPPAVRRQIDYLKKAGALAVKPTGSGDGGFLLSLWENDPPAELNLISIWDS